MTNNEILPIGLVSKADVLRLNRELELLDEALHQGSIRKGGQATDLPKVSQLLNDFAEVYQGNLLLEGDREKLIKILKKVHKDSPSVHMSFATTPTPAFLQKLVGWLRKEVHPTVLLQIGLQPSIAAGCILRTPNKVFDFSLREHLNRKQGILIDQVRGGTHEQ